MERNGGGDKWKLVLSGGSRKSSQESELGLGMVGNDVKSGEALKM